MPELKRVNVGGQMVLVEVEHDPGHRNPPLQQLNQAYRAEDSENRDNRDAVLDQIEKMRRQTVRPDGSRVQKPLAPHMIPKKAS